MITMGVERFKDCIDDIKPLLLKHWYEIANNQDTIPLDPDYDKYQWLDDQGMMRIYIARDAGELVGYFISFISPHIHYRSTVYAINDILYIDPAYRGGTQAYRMMKGAMKDLKDNGVDRLIIHMKVNHEFRKLLSALDFNLTEENWEREL